MKLYSVAAALANITVTKHEVTYDPDASWLKFHLGINRYALYSRDDPTVLQLVKDMQSMTVISAGEGQMGFGASSSMMSGKEYRLPVFMLYCQIPHGV